MRPTAKVLLFFSILLVAPVLAAAGDGDRFGAPDTLFAEVARIDDYNCSITLTITNDESLVGIAIPLKLSAGLNKIVADSAVYTGGRVAQWSYRGFRPDTAIQCVTLGMIANLGPSDYRLTPGSGRLVTVFVSSLEEKKIEHLMVDTTTTHPDNSLMAIVDTDQSETGDTAKVDFFDRELVPVWVVRNTDLAAPAKP
ncbi:MAG: hypothetical protein KKA42_07105 [candidate division Zixibacteria bacterium]|nr:hypothetical protein [candidate division Zixibacteria bacterium]